MRSKLSTYYGFRSWRQKLFRWWVGCLHKCPTQPQMPVRTPSSTDGSSTKLEVYIRQGANSRKAKIANGEGLRGLLPLHHYRTFIYASRVSQPLPVVCALDFINLFILKHQLSLPAAKNMWPISSTGKFWLWWIFEDTLKRRLFFERPACNILWWWWAKDKEGRWKWVNTVNSGQQTTNIMLSGELSVEFICFFNHTAVSSNNLKSHIMQAGGSMIKECHNVAVELLKE